MALLSAIRKMLREPAGLARLDAALARWARSQPALTGFASIEALIGFCRSSDPGLLTEKNRILRALPVMSVDLGKLVEPAFRELLAAMRFEASCEPASRKLYVRATLSPDILPSGVWVSSVPPVRFELTL